MGKSLFFKINDDITEIALYKITDIFPLPTKYITVDIGDTHDWYIPLNNVGAEFYSGLRYKINDTIYQVCSRCPLNIIAQYLNGLNYLIECNKNIYEQLSYVFQGAVTAVDDHTITFIGPSTVTGITKLFLCGTDIEIKTENLSLSTRYNAFGTSTYNAADTAHAMLIKLKPYEKYTLSFKNLNDISKNYIFLGYDIEHMNEQAGSYEKIYTNQYFLFKDNKLVNMLEDNDLLNTFEHVKNDVLSEIESKNTYNYYYVC